MLNKFRAEELMSQRKSPWTVVFLVDFLEYVPDWWKHWVGYYYPEINKVMVVKKFVAYKIIKIIRGVNKGKNWI